MKNAVSCKPSLLALLFATSLSTLTLHSQELYKPGRKGTVKEFTLTLPMSKSPQKIKAEVIDGMLVYEGDILLGPESSFSGQRAVAISGANYRWPNSVIYYVLPANHPKKIDIQWAIAHVQSSTNLCLVARTNQADYIQFVDASGCSSSVGRQGGRQNVNIGSCSRGSIAHEILHSAGLWHEQGREDRDNYITINWDNIEAGKEHNFTKHISDGIDIGVYDYGSIMHYPKSGFSKNGKNTIDIKVPPGSSSTSIGQRDGMSARDIAGINSLYAMGPCKEDCIGVNPGNITVAKMGTIWRVKDGSHILFAAPNKTEADKIAAIIRKYAISKTCFVGRPDPSFQYLLKGSAAPSGAMAGEDCLGFIPANLVIKQEGATYPMTDGNSRMFVFPNKAEADMALAMIKKYAFTKTCYVGRPQASLQYMRK